MSLLSDWWLGAFQGAVLEIIVDIFAIFSGRTSETFLGGPFTWFTQFVDWMLQWWYPQGGSF